MIGEAIVEFVGAIFGEFLVQTVLGGSLNVIGGVVRWACCSILCIIFNKKKFKFKEYIKGPDESTKWHDANHRFVNIMIAILLIFALVLIFTL